MKLAKLLFLLFILITFFFRSNLIMINIVNLFLLNEYKVEN